MRTRNLIPTTLTIAALALTGCAGTAATEPAPTATVTVTAEPTQEATTSPQPTETATHEAVAPPAPTSPAETNTAPVEAEPVGPDTATSIIDSIELIEDDIIITLTTSAEANATTTYAPYVLQVAMEELALDPELAAEIDLVAIYSSDGVMVASDRGGKWQ